MSLIRIYQWTISPLLGPRCKYWPSCSRYGYEAFARHGFLRGAGLTAWRILRCNPWSHGGVDEVPAERRRGGPTVRPTEVPPARHPRRAGRFGRSDTAAGHSLGDPTTTSGSPPALAGSARPQGAAE